MRFDRDRNGAWLVNPNELAPKLGLSADDLRNQMSRGLVSSRVEAGRDEDVGRSRITVTVSGHVWQGIFDARGMLVSESSYRVTHQ